MLSEKRNVETQAEVERALPEKVRRECDLRPKINAFHITQHSRIHSYNCKQFTFRLQVSLSFSLSIDTLTVVVDQFKSSITILMN